MPPIKSRIKRLFFPSVHNRFLTPAGFLALASLALM
jgi:hypothetical protein